MLLGKDSFKNITGLFNKYKYLLLVIAAGVILLIIPTGSDNKTADEPAKKEDYSIDEQEVKLEKLLESISGAGRVKVMLTLKTSMESQYANESQTEESRSDTAGNSFDQSEEVRPVIVSDASGGEQPVVIKQFYPEYQGALIVCDGAESPSVRLKIMEAVSSLLNLGSDKITVAKMKS